ncbi:MAG: asparagine--tRNA ligase [Patescibacteria group bacterium]
MVIAKIGDYKDKQVTIKGWVYNFRSSGKIAFLQIRDGSGFIQAIVEKTSVDEASWQVVQELTQESSVSLTGQVSEHPKQPGVYELQVTKLELIQKAEEYPISNKEHGPEFLLDNRHLWLRSKKQWAIQRVRNIIINAMYEYLNQEGFIKIDAPILTPTSCEGTTELFELEYFDEQKAYLSQSGQLYIEAGIFAHGRVFDFGPTFRAEKSKTRRHLSEFWMMDAEAAFVEHAENMQIQEGLIQHVAKKVLELGSEELAILERDTAPLEKLQKPFKRMTHAEAVAFLQKNGSDIGDRDDLGADDETKLTENSDVPIFVEKWPKEIKAFYMKRDDNDADLVLGADLIATEGFGEVIGGSERETDYSLLVKRMEEENLPQEPFQWYLDLRKYGSVPHSGFGVGLERLVAWMTGTHHVRETIPFPRMIHRLTP